MTAGAEAPAPGLRRAALYLTVATLRNRTRRQLRRLRSPRALLAVLLIAAYFGFLFLAGDAGEPSPDLLTSATANRLIVLAVFASAAWYWTLGDARRGLAFTPAEVHLLFPAPLTRRELVLYRVLRTQAVILGSVLIWTLLFRRAGSGLDLLLRPLALWTFFSTVYLHRLGATLVRVGALSHGGRGLRRLGVPLLLFALAAGVVIGGLATAWPPGGPQTFGAWGRWLEAGTAPLAVRLALAPAAIAVAPVYAADPAAWLWAMGPALLLLAVHLAWVVRIDAAFEEAAVEAAAWRARRLAARRAGAPAAGARRRWTVRLPLAPTGAPMVALLWKNTLAAMRGERLTTFVLVLPALAVAFALLDDAIPPRLREVVAAVVLTWAAMLVVMGPLWMRNDLRRDLARVALVRSWPLESSTIVLWSALSSALAITVLQLCGLLAAAAALGGGALGALPGAHPMGTVAALLVSLPGINLLAAVLQNGAALLFPAWVHLGPERPMGFEAAGQLYLTLFATLVMLALLLLAPAAVGLGIVLVGEPALGALALPLAALAGLLVAGTEAWFLTEVLGEVLDRLEPSEVAVA